MKRTWIVLIFVASIAWTGVYAQDVDYVRYVVKNLASKEMKGRGYVDEEMSVRRILLPPNTRDLV